ncbi:1-ACYL-SN-GLYCEROL-3-PHOSPHATE ACYLTRANSFERASE (1-AGP ACYLTRANSFERASE) (1-AGPAT) (LYSOPHOSPHATIDIC ACID ACYLTRANSFERASE) (LPAAT) [Mycoplasmopsis pulmonis]|uniref:1-ACYL-SN-GLYCEROL-3-PHOSPHATE ACYLTRANSFERASE (1-AGP ACYLTRANSFERASE) (1-AGPAT) (LYSOPHOSPHATIDIC ACID ACYLTRANSFERASE) (LPAAT) n=1 Tax=Mycoplasmopsis pulmonis (strain UAB CTIP) TaxID=272635 RepID=Q98R96_MYCPU|nr:lysophospholipid acyltransferase family protein [Mycoplasmopsis pulmonis]MDZ7293084.1 1-acyl-sn-glycerol-3-phosphate acyltransferase [Mycoplasmopsis pulmonis]CAC13287.1 1-ACYL-SN-GLYCEROL-3-PHOSPHATE ACYLTRANSFERASE (1-AGP ACYLTRANSFERASE) (1-AGPAT) (LYSOPHOSPHATIDIC ACID ACYLTRANSFERASE) (LPAAT) [Mycoplasmopsis pulmonis]VEU67877.1 1-acyl-sn-glycerol-3-phosphate acyltransferase [Mycoplasmopsis pulmonis]
MSPRLKLILLSPIWGFRILGLLKKARKFRKKPESLKKYDRYGYVNKLSNKVLKLMNIEVEVKGYENIIKAPAIVVSNHANNIDSLALMSAFENKSDDIDKVEKEMSFVAKIELKKNKVYSAAMELIECLFIDRTKIRQSWDKMKVFGDFLKENKKYGVIYAEGTRTTTGELGEFKSGAFKVAQKFWLPIIPVTINNSFDAVNFKDKTKRKITVIIHPALKPVNFGNLDSTKLAQLVKNKIESAYIKPEAKKLGEK